MTIHPALKQLLQEYARYQAKLWMVGIIANEDDLSVDKAAEKMELLAAMSKLIGFIVLLV